MSAPLRVARPGRGQGGFTLTELMVTMALGSAVTVAILGAMTQFTQAFRNQMRLAEAQQTGRAAAEVIGRDLRMAGYQVSSGLTVALDTESSVARAAPLLLVTNGTSANDFADEITVAYGTASAQTTIPTGAGPYTSATTTVVSSAGFAVGDLVVASNAGVGCVMKITSLTATTLVHNSGGVGSPWNSSANNACAALSAVWANGSTMISKLSMRSYRVRPNDARGVLEVSPSGGIVSGDWTELADGIVDFQVALQVREPGDTTDLDGDGDATLDWYAGNAMATALSSAPLPAPQKAPMSLHISIVTRGNLDNPVVGETTPGLCGTPINNNPLGDHCGVAIASVTNTASRYYRAALLRTATIGFDLRNLGTGVGTP